MTVNLKMPASVETLHAVRHVSFNPETGMLVIYFRSGQVRQEIYYGTVEVY